MVSIVGGAYRVEQPAQGINNGICRIYPLYFGFRASPAGGRREQGTTAAEESMSEMEERPLYERIYAIVRQIPPGQVATYGQIAEITGGCSPRLVGYAMSALRSGDHPDVPWQRVINRMGKISIHDPYGKFVQRQLLEQEGVEFDSTDCIDFSRFGWIGPPR
jgi:methylated-DNA-protein-cysteine methyltransferase related protein